MILILLSMFSSTYSKSVVISCHLYTIIMLMSMLNILKAPKLDVNVCKNAAFMTKAYLQCNLFLPIKLMSIVLASPKFYILSKERENEAKSDYYGLFMSLWSVWSRWGWRKSAEGHLPGSNQSEQSGLIGKGGLQETGSKTACFRRRLN